MVTEGSFGEVDGQRARSFSIDSGSGVSLILSDYGARLVALNVPDRDGTVDDIVLGFDNAQAYADSTCYFGATVGRYANRIALGQFDLLGIPIQVDCNEGRNHLHGGHDGWDRRVWAADCADTSVTFTTVSPPGEMGFPGRCEVSTTYDLQGRTLRITMEAISSETTVINMVNHSYFNLAGHASGHVLAQQMRLPSDFYVPVDDELLATGEVRAVASTAFDFRDLRTIGLLGGEDRDHNWCLRGGSAELAEAAEVYDPGSGRRLRLWTSEPGVQMYTGGKLDNRIIGKGGARYCRNAGFTLETQKFPGSPNFAHFPTAILRAGELYRHEMVFEFSTD